MWSPVACLTCASASISNSCAGKLPVQPATWDPRMSRAVLGAPAQKAAPSCSIQAHSTTPQACLPETKETAPMRPLFPDNEYMFVDLEQKLSKFFSKDWKREMCKVS